MALKNSAPQMAADPLEEIMRQALAERGAVPADASSPDPLAAALQPPAGPDGYMIDLPRGMDRDLDLEGRARRWFHEAGLPQNLVTGIVREYCRCLGAAPVDGAGARAELARDWGDACDSRLDLARSIVARCGDREVIAALLAESGLGNNPWLIRSLAALAEADRAQAEPEGDRA